MEVLKGIKADHSRFKDIYNASRTPTFETATIETQTDHTGNIPKKGGRPKGSKNKRGKKQMSVGADTDADTDFMSPERQDTDLQTEKRRYRGGLRGSKDRLDTVSEPSPQTPKTREANFLNEDDLAD